MSLINSLQILSLPAKNIGWHTPPDLVYLIKASRFSPGELRVARENCTYFIVYVPHPAPPAPAAALRTVHTRSSRVKYALRLYFTLKKHAPGNKLFRVTLPSGETAGLGGWLTPRTRLLKKQLLPTPPVGGAGGGKVKYFSR